MENFSIYKYMKLGIVHFKAYPQATTGEVAARTHHGCSPA